MHEDIPPLRRPEDKASIRCHADLDRHWRSLMGPLGFGQAALRVQFVGIDDPGEAVITKIEDPPDRPRRSQLGCLNAPVGRKGGEGDTSWPPGA